MRNENKILLVQFTFRGSDVDKARTFDPYFSVSENIIKLGEKKGSIGAKVTVEIKTELEGGAYDLLKYDIKTGEWKRIRSAIVDENGYATFIVINYGEYKLAVKKLL